MATAPASEAPRAGEVSAEAGFEQLYRTSRDDVYSYAAGLLRDRSAAEEVTGQAFERAWRKRRQLDPARGSARAWLFGIARNAALDELRRRRRTAELQAHDAVEPGLDPGEAAVRRQVVSSALETLEPRERELIALKFFAGLGNAEIAAVLGISETNAGTKLNRTIEKLRMLCEEGV